MIALTAKLPKPIKSKNPVVILRHVIKAIKEDPKRYDQSTYLNEKDTDGDYRPKNYFSQCGTVCCVAGWVNVIAGKNHRNYARQPITAQRVLGLSDEEAMRLFSGSPPEVRRRDQFTARQHAADGIKHIKRFVLKKWGVKL